MPPTIRLPRPDGTIEPYVMRDPPLAWTAPAGPIQSRVAFAAAHVVADPLADRDPLSEAPLDWEATLAYRRYLWSLGLAVAEAMDTAQRGGAGGTWRRTLVSRSSVITRVWSTGSSSRCSTPDAKSSSARASPTACGCTRATICTTTS